VERVAIGILAGGRGMRFGGRDKGWIELGGQPLVARVLEQVRPQGQRILVSANRHFDDYRGLGIDVVPDRWPDHPGPLAGIASLLATIDEDWLLTLPVDLQELPPDFVAAMLAARGGEPMHVVVAEDADGMQPLFALYPRVLAAHAAETIEHGRRSVREWQHRFPVYPCVFGAHRFGNLNSPADIGP
jgi:molybdenum cofactor guanylyltransferase